MNPLSAVLWSVFVQQSISYILAEPIHSNLGWAGRRLLNSTIEPEKSIFDKIKEFYDDPNNLAMWGVLPLIVLVYGGFCVIYCVCKGYDDCKKKKNKKAKKKRLLDDEDDELITANSSGEHNNNFNDTKYENTGRSATRAAMAATFAAKNQSNQAQGRKHATSTSDVKLAVERENSTPLPWAIPDEDSLYPTKDKGHPPPPPAPAQEQKLNLKPLSINQPTDKQPYKAPNRKPHPDMHMPPSPPPPYDFGRRDSVEEISMNPRKIHAVSNRANDPRKAMNAMEQYALARQAAQLLRVDNGQPGQPGYKKPKRLVFVAE
ncbi:uncharacterized protein LOC143067678 [Mytilus galloprovincialis]|uniref:uncharacterized protein LOC143067678 n=1 Tax=Mytilus galloprovincialis TaxID=29158 RepID=UPI003F7C970E